MAQPNGLQPCSWQTGTSWSTLSAKRLCFPHWKRVSKQGTRSSQWLNCPWCPSLGNFCSLWLLTQLEQKTEKNWYNWAKSHYQPGFVFFFVFVFYFCQCPTFIYIWNVFNTVMMDVVHNTWQQQDLLRNRTLTTVYHASIYIYTNAFLFFKKKKGTKHV